MRISITDFLASSPPQNGKWTPSPAVCCQEWEPHPSSRISENIFWVLQVPLSSLRAKKPQCLNKKPADVNSELELHLHSDRKSLLKQPPEGKDIHIHPFNAVSYPSPSRWILVSLHRRRTIPIVQLLLEEKC